MEKYRLPIITFLTAAILVACFYAANFAPLVDPAPEEKLQDPGLVGDEFVIDHATLLENNGRGIVFEINNEVFRGISEVEVEGEPGQDISLGGTIESQGVLKIDFYKLNPLRAWKYVFSLGALFLVVFILFRKYTWSWSTFQFSEKDSPKES